MLFRTINSSVPVNARLTSSSTEKSGDPFDMLYVGNSKLIIWKIIGTNLLLFVKN